MADSTEDYSLYLNKDSFVTDVFTTDNQAIFVCSALTGTSVINATYASAPPSETSDSFKTMVSCYSKDMLTLIRSFRDNPVDSNYGLNNTSSTHNLTFLQAINKAQELGKKHIIRITDSGYHIIDIN